MQNAVSPPRPSRKSQNRVDATRQARRLLALLEQLGEDRDERRRERRVGDERPEQVRNLERDREGVDLARGAEVVGRDDLADEAEHAREARGGGKQRRRPREPAAGTLVHAASIGRGLNGATARRTAFGTIRRARGCGPFHAMPNIKQQKKRVRTAGVERLENLRYRSTAKTLAKRLEAAVQAGDRDARRRRAPGARPLARPGRRPRCDAPQHRGAPQGPGRPARLGRELAGGGRFARPRDVDQRPLELEVDGEAGSALDRVVELGETHDRVPQLVRRRSCGPARRASPRRTDGASAGAAASRALRPSSARSWHVRTRPTCPTSSPTSRGSSLEPDRRTARAASGTRTARPRGPAGPTHR